MMCTHTVHATESKVKVPKKEKIMNRPTITNYLKALLQTLYAWKTKQKHHEYYHKLPKKQTILIGPIALGKSKIIFIINVSSSKQKTHCYLYFFCTNLSTCININNTVQDYIYKCYIFFAQLNECKCL